MDNNEQPKQQRSPGADQQRQETRWEPRCRRCGDTGFIEYKQYTGERSYYYASTPCGCGGARDW